ncbi:MAG: hypothetical protein CO141_02380 [Candidatus Moranbacteria bacterium CG_4_9_14_3_um_filter_42_9]|nr:MAG: hypothetical protein CO141_02380 [Candidatus Moranbacteria bacterium CG_4_9_14_3_um_filter_42_9]
MAAKKVDRKKSPHRLVLGQILDADSLKSLKTTSLQKGMSDFSSPTKILVGDKRSSAGIYLRTFAMRGKTKV